jgi:D-amino-acid dehydrogenase
MKMIRSAGEFAMASNKHILIVGGGIIGLCTAYYSVRRGHRVTIVERGKANEDGCSFGNAGYITPSHFVPLAAPGMVAKGFKWMWNPGSPFYIKPSLDGDLLRWGWKFIRASRQPVVDRVAPFLLGLNLASRACYEELAEESSNDFHLVKEGLLLLCMEQQTLDHEARLAEEATRLGLTTEVLDARQLAAREPNVRMNAAGAVYYAEDCHFTPKLLMASLTARLRKAGVNVIEEEEVIGWRSSGQSIGAVVTTRDEFSADEYVLCGGSWSPSIVRQLGISLPMQAGKGYSLTLPKPRSLPRFPAIFVEARVAITPMGTSLRVGGTMEIAGMGMNINPPRIRGLINSVRRFYPEFSDDDFRNIPPWCGLRPCSPDGLPYVGRFRNYRNLSVATGHAMLGMSLGPITGKLMAETLSGVPPSMNMAELSPDRYA